MILVKPYIWELNPVTQLPRLSALIVLLIICTWGAGAQTPAVHNINKYNGLSTNHVYCTLIDRMGYLWLGTTDGVYRYNGYTLRKYDYTDGLPNVDVWNLYEDKRGRVWLRSIAKGIGYLKNNRYHPVVVKSDSMNEVIYPAEFIDLDSILIFSTKNPLPQTLAWAFIRNDTVEFRQRAILEYNSEAIYFTQDKMIIANNDSTLHYPIAAALDKNLQKHTPRVRKSSTKHMGYLSSHNFSATVKNIRFFSNPGLDYIMILDLEKNATKKISLSGNKNELIAHVFHNNDSIYALTNHNGYCINTLGTITDTISLSNEFPSASVYNFNATHFINDSLWGKCLSTNNNGSYINFPVPDAPMRHDLPLADYKHVSGADDSKGYWWNDLTNTISILSNGVIKKNIHVNQRVNVQKITPYNAEKSLLMTPNALYWLYNDGTIINFLSNVDSLYGLTSPPESFLNTFSSVSDIIIIDSTNFIFQGSAYVGCAHVASDYNARKMHIEIFDPERCKGMFYYPKLDCHVLYNNDKIILYNIHTKRKSIISPDLLKAIKIQRIEQIVPDKYGNLIIKDYNRLIIFNPRNGRFSSVLDNYNFQNSFISMHGATLSVAGIFGVLQCNTTPQGEISNIRNYPNTKTLFYKYVYDVQFSRDNILLKTDNGTYIVWPDKTNGLLENENYKVVIDNSGHLSNIYDGDTLDINQAINALGIDIIKPTGSGNLMITYSVNGSNYTNTGYQLILPALKPGSYNTVSLIASDDSWRSKPIKFTIYVQPKWWQTQTAKRVIVVLSLLAFIGFVYLVIVMTRRFVNKANERRNQRRELELKSIYSQINPHFIFNSLSTAQYFVKKNQNKEAFEHINQFSDLLRAYIKSSRAKYITIAEEIETLENYLQLQLTRFEEKFEYTIEVDKSVNPGKVKIPSLLLQPLVENALNHGIFHSDKKGKLSIIFKIEEQDKDTLICIVDDDGIGRQKSKEMRGKIIRKADSYGTILIKELIDTFNKYEKINIEIEYIDKQLPLTGTTVIIRIKNFTHAQ